MGRFSSPASAAAWGERKADYFKRKEEGKE